jgi:hypothetical protein
VQKKFLIAAAAAVAGVLALTPLAFASDYARDDSDQRNQVNLCSSDQDVDVLPSTVVGAILPSASQEQNGNCVNIADGAGAGAEPTAPPTTTTPPPPGPTYENQYTTSPFPGGEGTVNAYCYPGDTPLSFSIDDPGQIVTSTTQVPQGVEVTFNNQTDSRQDLGIFVTCEDTNPGNP